ncbi:MAG: flagellar basal body P-ring formation protein FlgA [Pirellulales bacterium]|nr:flagellar basal body P-ring formation protein FlgA [Pirellulales bacterium]
MLGSVNEAKRTRNRPLSRKRVRGAAQGRLAAVAFFAVALLSAGETLGIAADVQIRRECRPSGRVVTLGDVAEVRASDPQQAAALARVELLPAPPVGQPRFLRVREIQDLLLLRGINLAEHCFSGYSQVTIHAPELPRVADAAEPLAPPQAKRAERQLREAVLAYLNQAAGNDEAWDVRLSVSDELARRIHNSGGAVTVQGGTPPWSGTQRLEISVGANGQSERIAIDVQIRAIPAIVVTTHSVPRGALITAADVELRRSASAPAQSDCFHAIDQVVGSEATQAIGEGMVIESKMVRTPLLVRRNEIVTVYARSGAVRVRTAARARDDGSLNDLIGVETLADRQVFFARVSGIRELEIYGRAAQASTVAGQESNAAPFDATAAIRPANPPIP